MRDAVEPGWRDLKIVVAPSRPKSSAARTAKPGRTLKWRPFPVDALPQPLRRFVRRGAKALGCDPCYLILPLLSALAASIGTTRRVRLKRGWTEPAIIWTAMIGESGSLKTPAFKLVMRALRDLQGALLRAHQRALHDYEKDLRDYERELQTWKRGKDVCDPPEKPEPPQAERILVSDTTVEALAPILLANPRGVLLARDELAGWISSFDRYSGGKGAADAAHWLSMHVGESLTVDRKTGHSRTIFVPRAAVSIAGGIQPRILARVLGQQHRESGLAARILLAAPPRAPKRWTDSDIAPEHEAELALLYERLMELKPFINGEGEQEPVDVPLLPDASAAFVDFYNDHNRQQTELTGDLAAAWSKLEAYCARIALVIHFTRWASDDPALKTPDAVDCGSVQAATTIVKWFSHETVRVYAQLDETEEERDRRRLVDWIETKGGEVTVRDLMRGPRQYRGEAEEAEACLNGLVRAGYGTWEGRRPDRTGGRPCRVFKLATSGDGDETPETRGTAEVLSQGNASGGDSEDDPPPNHGESDGDGSGWVRLVI